MTYDPLNPGEPDFSNFAPASGRFAPAQGEDSSGGFSQRLSNFFTGHTPLPMQEEKGPIPVDPLSISTPEPSPEPTPTTPPVTPEPPTPAPTPAPAPETPQLVTGDPLTELPQTDEFVHSGDYGEKLLDLVEKAWHANSLQDWFSGKHNAIAEAAAKRIADIKEATGVDIPNPYQGDFAAEATKILNDQRQSGMRPLFDPVKDVADKQALELKLFQNALDDLASRFHGDTDHDRDVLQIIGANRPLTADMPDIVSAAQSAERAAYKATGGGVIPSIASIGTDIAGSFRNPVNAAGVVIGPGELSVAGKLLPTAGRLATAAVNITEASVKQALINMGLQAVQEPMQQSWQRELGEDNGLVPALKDIGFAGLAGAVPGAAIEGIKQVARYFAGPSSKAAIDEFIRQAQGQPPNPEFASRATQWRKEIDDFLAEKERAEKAGEPLKLPPPKPFEAPPAAENRPSATSLTPTQIESAELDHLASPPHIEGVPPSENLEAYQGAVRHAEDPDVIAPPAPPISAPEHGPIVIPPDHVQGFISPSPGHTDTLEGKPVTYTTFDPRTLGTDAQAFQYKGGGDQSGVTDRLKGVQKWNPLASGNVVVFERTDGSRYIVDGHQRLGLATRLLNDGHSPIQFNGALIKEADGWTPADARAVAAKKNIQEGSGEPLDTARVLRDRPDMWDDSLPITSPRLKQAKGLAELSDQAWGMMLNGVVPQNYASLVGQMVPNKTNHAAVMADLAHYKPANENEARMIIADANAAGFSRETQQSLFGIEEATKSLTRERAQVYASVLSLLNDDKKVFSTLDREASRIEAAGNVLVDTNADRATRAAQLAQILSQLATRQGPVSAALNRAAQNVADGSLKPAAAARGFLDDIDRLVKEEGLRIEATQPLKPALPEVSSKLDMPNGKQEQIRALEADLAQTPRTERVPEMSVAGKEEPAQTVAVMAPSDAAVATAEAGAGPQSAPMTPQPGLTPEEILARPEVQQAIKAPREINREHDVPYLAGSSNDGGTTYIDKRIPPKVKIGRKNVDVAKYLNVHEQVEHALMVIGGLSYEKSHPIAQVHERAAVEADGINWNAYTHVMDGYISSTEEELGRIIDPPPNLYPKPYPHDEQEILRRSNAGENTIANAPASPLEATVRDVAHRAAVAAAQSPDPLDRQIGEVLEKEVAPLIDQAFPKEQVTAPAQSKIPDDIPKTVFRGHGRESVGSAYNPSGAATPIAGPAKYFAFDKEAASHFGPNIEQAATGDVVKNPLVIRDGNEWRALTKEAGWEFPNPYGTEIEKMKAMAQRLQDIVRQKGYDGMIVTWPANSRDIGPKGENLKLLKNVFGDPQVIAFGDAQAPAIERTAVGDQTLIPGVKPVTDAARAQIEANKPLRGGNAAMPSGGLFDTVARAQTDMFDLIPTDNGLVDRQRLLDSASHESVLSKFVGECDAS